MTKEVTNLRIKMIERRKELGLTQQTVANFIGKKRNTVTGYEQGKLTPPLDIAIKIKEILQTNDDNIFLNHNVIINDK